MVAGSVVDCVLWVGWSWGSKWTFCFWDVVQAGRNRYGSYGGVSCVVLVVVFGLGLGKGAVQAVVPPTGVVVVFEGFQVAFPFLCPGPAG